MQPLLAHSLSASHRLHQNTFTGGRGAASALCLVDGTIPSGGTDGLGLEIAKQLSAHSVEIALMARRKEHLDRAAKELSSAKAVHTFPADVADAPALGQAIQQAINALGALDIVVLSAGNAGPEYLGLDADSEDSFAYLEKVHVHSTLAMFKVRRPRAHAPWSCMCTAEALHRWRKAPLSRPCRTLKR
jgi:NAD(P)-dependent dehydrogenase (short-subunit alcohol dehydrogenase family)